MSYTSRLAESQYPVFTNDSNHQKKKKKHKKNRNLPPLWSIGMPRCIAPFSQPNEKILWLYISMYILLPPAVGHRGHRSWCDVNEMDSILTLQKHMLPKVRYENTYYNSKNGCIHSCPSSEDTTICQAFELLS